MAEAIMTLQNAREEEEEEESDDRHFPRMAQATAHGGERQVSAGGASNLGETTDSAAFRRTHRKSDVPVFFANSSAVMPKPLLCSSLLVTLTYWFCFVYSQVVHQDTTASWEIRASFKNFEEIMDRRSSKLKSAGGDDQPDDQVFKDGSSFVQRSDPSFGYEDWGDMYSWFRAGYVPLLWEEGPHGRGLLANRIRLIGGVRFGKEEILDSGHFAANPGSPLRWLDVNMYHICQHFVLPLTRRESCSYVELVASDLQPPEPGREHARSRNKPDDGSDRPQAWMQTSYWCCTLANNQHDLSALRDACAAYVFS
eukprot:s337_g21.t1